MMTGVVEVFKEKHEVLSQLDSDIGDGDHGVSMLRGMKKLEALMAQSKTTSIQSLTYDMGFAFLGVDGGATGPLMGMLLLGMSEGVGDRETLDADGFAAMFESALASVQRQTGAKVGDKTMMDALIPAVQVLRQAADEGKPIEEMLDRAVEAAEKGAISTKEFRARFGRAKNMGDRTIGYQDPGATSILFIFQGLREGLAK
jgi:dihydroxyacetone kinase-like protein